MSKLTRNWAVAALDLADVEQSKIGQREKELFGLSSIRLRCFINNLCSKENINVLDIGTYRGATAISAAYGNPKTKVVTVDNFSYDEREPKKWAPEGGYWENVKSQFEANIKRYEDPNAGVDVKNITAITSAFEDVDWSKQPKFDVCFFDVTPVKDDTYDNFFTKVLSAMSPESVVVFTSYSNEKHAIQLQEAIGKYGDIVEVQWKEQRISGGLSDATKYYSGILVAGLKKKAVTTPKQNKVEQAKNE